jgi:stage II sporulation SpoE-like protein
MNGIRRSRLSALPRAAAIAASFVALCCPAGAALAQLPNVEAPPAPQPVQDLAREPVPEPVEQVVQDSPAGSAYQGVRDTVDGALGGGSGGGDPGGGSGGSGGGSGGGGGGGSQANPTGSAPVPGSGSPSEGSPRRSRDGTTGGSRRGDGPGRSARRARDSRPGSARDGGGQGSAPGARDRGRDAKSGAGSGAGFDNEGGVPGPIGDIVEVIPAPVLIALALLAGLGLALNLRAGLLRRRASWLEREREQLLLDVGVLQRAMLPVVPERLGALEASVAYRPAEGPAAGGDFYDAFELLDGRVAVIVGDVAGHGREALVKTASVRHTLAAYLRGGLSPRAALGTVGSLLSDADDSVFTTVVVAVHDPAAGTLTYATAGHPPPIFHGPGRHEPVIEGSSPPLGAGIATGQRQTTLHLGAGSVVWLFTDGLIEARANEGLLGRERLDAMAAELGPDDPAAALLEAVAAEADRLPDDMAACVLRAVEGSPREGRRIEELELWGDLGELRAAERFLEACGVRGDELAASLAEAAAALKTFGTALLRVGVGDGEPEVSVKPQTLGVEPVTADELASVTPATATGGL